MRLGQVVGAALVSAAISVAAHAQMTGQAAADPCYQPRLFGGVSPECLAERNQQWQDYYAQQTRKREEAEARAQAASAAEAQAEAERAAEARRQATDAARAAARARFEAYASMVRAETSPDNQCRNPDIARSLLEEWSSFDAMKLADLKAIDIEHLTTVKADLERGVLVCHGVFKTNTGRDFIGTLSTKKNIAGDPMTTWKADESQDESVYDAPPNLSSAPADTQETASATPASQLVPDAKSLSRSFASGLAARQQWEAWLASLSGDEKDGAIWWAASRNTPGHLTCATAPNKDNSTWSAGCMNAQLKLAPVDLSRRQDLQYKKGWNSY